MTPIDILKECVPGSTTDRAMVIFIRLKDAKRPDPESFYKAKLREQIRTALMMDDVRTGEAEHSFESLALSLKKSATESIDEDIPVVRQRAYLGSKHTPILCGVAIPIQLFESYIRFARWMAQSGIFLSLDHTGFSLSSLTPDFAEAVRLLTLEEMGNFLGKVKRGGLEKTVGNKDSKTDPWAKDDKTEEAEGGDKSLTKRRIHGVEIPPILEESPISGTQARVTDTQSLKDFVEYFEKATRDRKDSMVPIAKSIFNRPDKMLAMRPVSSLSPGWKKKLAELKVAFPNFHALWDYCEAELFVSERGGVARISPVMLAGPPGVGKSVAVEALASLMGVPMHRIQMEAQTNPSTLIGSAKHWYNSEPGILFDVLFANSACVANPVLMLDEIDKCPSGNDARSMDKPLLGLLEPQSAAKFRDQSIPEIAIDTTRVSWIATANYLERISPPILSRFNVLKIDSLNREQTAVVAQRIADATAKRFGLPAKPLPKEALERVLDLSPREIRRVMETAAARVLMAKEMREVRSLAQIESKTVTEIDKAVSEIEKVSGKKPQPAQAEQSLLSPDASPMDKLLAKMGPEAKAWVQLSTMTTISALKAVQLAQNMAAINGAIQAPEGETIH